jgi:HD-like signal output (HDOD) protein
LRLSAPPNRNRVVASDSHSVQQLTQVILRDLSLTTKLLQVVNSVRRGRDDGQGRITSFGQPSTALGESRRLAAAIRGRSSNSRTLATPKLSC